MKIYLCDDDGIITWHEVELIRVDSDSNYWFKSDEHLPLRYYGNNIYSASRLEFSFES